MQMVTALHLSYFSRLTSLLAYTYSYRVGSERSEALWNSMATKNIMECFIGPQSTLGVVSSLHRRLGSSCLRVRNPESFDNISASAESKFVLSFQCQVPCIGVTAAVETFCILSSDAACLIIDLRRGTVRAIAIGH